MVRNLFLFFGPNFSNLIEDFNSSFGLPVSVDILEGEKAFCNCPITFDKTRRDELHEDDDDVGGDWTKETVRRKRKN